MKGWGKGKGKGIPPFSFLPSYAYDPSWEYVSHNRKIKQALRQQYLASTTTPSAKSGKGASQQDEGPVVSRCTHCNLAHSNPKVVMCRVCWAHPVKKVEEKPKEAPAKAVEKQPVAPPAPKAKAKPSAPSPAGAAPTLEETAPKEGVTDGEANALLQTKMTNKLTKMLDTLDAHKVVDPNMMTDEAPPPMTPYQAQTKKLEDIIKSFEAASHSESIIAAARKDLEEHPKTKEEAPKDLTKVYLADVLHEAERFRTVNSTRLQKDIDDSKAEILRLQTRIEAHKSQLDMVEDQYNQAMEKIKTAQATLAAGSPEQETAAQPNAAEVIAQTMQQKQGDILRDLPEVLKQSGNEALKSDQAVKFVETLFAWIARAGASPPGSNGSASSTAPQATPSPAPSAAPFAPPVA